MSKKVAICITITREKLYKELLKSIKNQSYKNYKIYTVKDVIPVGTAKKQVVDLALLDNPDLIQLIDDDDIMEKDFIKRQVEEIGDYDFISTWGKTFGDNEGHIHYKMPTLKELTDWNSLHGWMMFKPYVLREENYREGLDTCDDWDLYIRLLKKGFKGKILEEELLNYRIHSLSQTKTQNSEYPKRKKMIMKINNIKPDKFVFHILGLAHLPTSRTFMSCAFTQKNIKLPKMLVDNGHTVYLYGCRGEDRLEDYMNSENFHFVETHTIEDIAKDYGVGYNLADSNGLGYEWRKQDFKHDFDSEKKPSTLKFYANAVNEINKRKEKDHFLLCSQGYYQKPIADAVKLFLTCESGIGYRGSVEGNFRAFESAYMQNFSYGSEHPGQSMNGSFYDRVIPNYFEENEVLFKEKKEDYFLFIGRTILRKGITIAIDTCNAIGKKLIIAGQGAIVRNDGVIEDIPPKEWERPPGTWEYIGYADVEKRKQLMANATAVFTPTIFLDCFCGVHAETMLSGTPVISTDFGVFSGDTFTHGVHGFKCNTLQDFVNAAKNAHKLDPKIIRKNGERFLMKNVYKLYEKWFQDLYQVFLSTDGKTRGWSYVE